MSIRQGCAMTLAQEVKEAVRAADNCPFYPACYITGDCNQDDWRNGTCGLPAPLKERVHAEQRAESALRNARWRLGEQLKGEALRGLHDDKLPKPSTRARS